MPEAVMKSMEGLTNTLLTRFSKNGVLKLRGVSSSSAKAFLVAHMLKSLQRPLLWVVDDEHVTNRIVNDLQVWGVPHVFGFKPELQSRAAELKLVRALHFMSEGIAGVIVITAADLPGVPTPVAKELTEHTIHVTIGSELSPTKFFNDLIDAGYEVADGVLVPIGRYVRRGGIIDIFPINTEKPVRIELDGDTVQSIRTFDFASGEILKEMTDFRIAPIDVTSEEGKLLSFAGRHGITVLDEYPVEKAPDSRIEFEPFTESLVADDDDALQFKSVLRFANPTEFAKDLMERIGAGWDTVIFTTDKEKVWNLLIDQGFIDEDLRHVTLISRTGAETLDDKLFLESDDGAGKSAFPESFQNRALKVLVLTDHEIFGTYAEPSRARRFNADVDAAFLASLSPGDLVVHIDHGIGRFEGVEQKTVDGTTKEYLHLGYAKGDKLYVPVEQADKVNKYIGATGENAPQLTRLGSADWDTVTHHARTESLEVAKELLDLYARRHTAQGQVFPGQTAEIQRFADDFPYVETPGQLKTIAEVQKDLASPKPMDRLICGDVGFGKTEVAMRAAFQVVQSGKQVAVLAPITILADQHFRTFKKRMAHWPIEIQLLSRFRTQAQQRETLKELKKGMVDIAIGTHRLLQDDIEFKDLGLVIVDEEQRFGVRQKEKLKKLRTGVDVLSMTATPIPRTLNFALSGLRDISTITTPPPGRLPIATEVKRFSMPLIRDVIMRELNRKGQVYFLHNRVQTIEGIAEKLRTLVPEAKFVIAHGQLDSDELENRILAFKDQTFDVLISSTIIENGIDLPNANTLIVDQAERLGLAQAYQLRGRVGRSKVQAYAYFLYHSQKLDDSAKKRLRAIVEATELGSGFQIAMRDLEIRGAGDILGSKQHGAINAIGVSHFTRLLKKAIEDLKLGKTQTEILEKPSLESTVELAITAYIPDEYIGKQSEKLKFYQRLAGCTDLATLHELHGEIEERYGPLPEPTTNLLDVLEIKILASEAGVKHVKEIHPEGKKYIELVLGKQVKPGAIVHLLEHQSLWQVSGESLKIRFDALGEQWFPTLKAATRLLMEGKDLKIQNPKFKQTIPSR